MQPRNGETKLSKLNYEKIEEWLVGTDGYGIVASSFFHEMGIELRPTTYSSNKELGKNAATRNDGEAGDVVGIAEFSAIDAIAHKLGVQPCHDYHGRGKNFRTTAGRVLAEVQKLKKS